jgi:surface polysaccharide O-acyltransferase-like enzyme
MSSQTEQLTSQLPGAASTAPAVQAGASNGSRVLFVDNLRVLLISMAVVVHLDDTYGAVGSWYYHDPATNLLTGILLTSLNAIGMASGMGFFFLLAGYFTPGSYDRRGPRSFLRDRLVRLGIPLLLYDLLLDPLVVYIASGLHGSYWATLIFGGLVFPSMMQAAGAAGTRQAGYPLAGGFHWLSLVYARWESFMVVGVCISFLVLFRTRWNRQGRLAKGLAASAYTVYLIHPVVLVGFSYAFHAVALYPLLKFVIAVLITLPLCFLASLFIRKIPLAKRIL